MKHKLLKKKLSVTFLSMAMLITTLPQFNTPILAQDRWTSGQPTLSPGNPTTPGEPTWTPGEPTTPGEPEEMTPDVEFMLSDWKAVEDGDTIALVQPVNPIQAKFYYIPSSYNGKRIEIGHDGSFSFGDNFTVDKLQIGSPDEDKVFISKYNDGNSLFFTAIKNTSIKVLDLRGLDVSNITDMSNLFSGYESLRKIDLTGWEISQVEDMSYMFWNCKNLKTFIAPLWTLKRLKSTQGMFAGCQSLTNLDCANWNLCAALNMNAMFLDCESLTSTEGFYAWWFNREGQSEGYENGVNTTDLSQMFSGCSKLESLNGIEMCSPQNIVTTRQMFYGCEKLTSPHKISYYDFSKVEDMSQMFAGCINLMDIKDCTRFNVSSVKDMSEMFKGCRSLKSLDGLETWDVSKVENMSGMFSNCYKINDLDPLEDWWTKTGNIKDLSCLFVGCYDLRDINGLSKWNVANVEDMTSMFAYCPNIESLKPLTKWNVSNVRQFSDMFSGCLGLKSLEGLENWKPTNVEDITCMFALCKNIEDFTAIEKWEMPTLKKLACAFYGCEKLKSLNMSNWQLDLNADQIDIQYMFSHCPSLEFVDFSLLNNYKKDLVVENVLNTIGEHPYYLDATKSLINSIKEDLKALYPGVDVGAIYPVEIEDYFPGECKDVPLMVLSNHEGLKNALYNGRGKYAFTVIYNGNGLEFKTRAMTHDELISGSNFVYPNNEAVINDFVSKINDKGSELVTDRDVEWYLDNACTIPLNTFNFMQQENKTINVYAKYSIQETNNAPVINASDITLVVGDEFDPLKGVTATDVEDGEIKDIEVVGNEVDTSKPGVYKVSYKVVDSKGIYTIKTIYVTVQLSSEKINHAPTINANDITLMVGDEFVPLKGVTATDVEDGEIKDIAVIENNVDTSKPGTYQVTYKVVDSLGASRIRTINVIVKLGTEKINHAPIISANDVTLVVGDEFDPLKGVSATDYEDGAIKEIKVIENNVDTSKAGTYKVTYKVVDSQKATVLKSIYVVVNMKADKLNHVPVINAMDVTLNVGDKFDALKDVSAIDKEDGILEEIEVIENNVDTSKAGIYEVVYKVTDRDGASVCKTIKVTVISDEEIVSPPTADYTNPSIYIMTSGLALVAFYLLKKKKIKA